MVTINIIVQYEGQQYDGGIRNRGIFLGAKPGKDNGARKLLDK